MASMLWLKLLVCLNIYNANGGRCHGNGEREHEMHFKSSRPREIDIGSNVFFNRTIHIIHKDRLLTGEEITWFDADKYCSDRYGFFPVTYETFGFLWEPLDQEDYDEVRMRMLMRFGFHKNDCRYWIGVHSNPPIGTYTNSTIAWHTVENDPDLPGNYSISMLAKYTQHTNNTKYWEEDTWAITNNDTDIIKRNSGVSGSGFNDTMQIICEELHLDCGSEFEDEKTGVFGVCRVAANVNTASCRNTSQSGNALCDSALTNPWTCCPSCVDSGCANTTGYKCTSLDVAIKQNMQCYTDLGTCNTTTINTALYNSTCMCCNHIPCTDQGCKAQGGECADTSMPGFWTDYDLKYDTSFSTNANLCRQQEKQSCRCVKKTSCIDTDFTCQNHFDGLGVCVDLQSDPLGLQFQLSLEDPLVEAPGLCDDNGGRGCSCFKKREHPLTTTTTTAIPTRCRNGYTQVGSKCWKVSTTLSNFLDALQECNGEGGSLASIGSQAEQTQLVSMIGTANTWIGFEDITNEGNFRWTDGSAVTFQNWKPNQPNNNNNRQHCVNVRPSDSGLWDDVVCGKLQPYVCQVPVI